MKSLLMLSLIFFYPSLSFTQDLNTLLLEYNKGNARFVIDNADHVKSDKTSIDISLLQGRAYADLGYFTKAFPYLKFVNKNIKAAPWQRAWSAAYLGVCYYGLGMYNASKNALTATIKANITENSSQFAYKRIKLYGFTKRYENFTSVKTRNIIFHFDPLSLKMISDTSEFIKLRTSAYRAIASFLDESLEGDVNFFIWSSKSLMNNELNEEDGFAVPPMRIVHSLYFQTPGHELTHIFSKIDNSYKSSLINEGIAVYLDQSPHKKVIHLNKVEKDRDFIKRVWNSKSSDKNDFYPIAGAFVGHLIETAGKRKFLELFKMQTLENAKKIYGEDWIMLTKSFVEKSIYN